MLYFGIYMISSFTTLRAFALAHLKITIYFSIGIYFFYFIYSHFKIFSIKLSILPYISLKYHIYIYIYLINSLSSHLTTTIHSLPLLSRYIKKE